MSEVEDGNLLGDERNVGTRCGCKSRKQSENKDDFGDKHSGDWMTEDFRCGEGLCGVASAAQVGEMMSQTTGMYSGQGFYWETC